MTEWILLGLVVLLIAANGFFVAAEFALVTVDRPGVRRAAAQGDGRAGSVQKALTSLSTQLSSCQLGITITSLVVGFIAEPSLAALLRRGPLAALGLAEAAALPLSFTIAFVIATVSQMVFGELVPKNWALAEPMQLARLIATPHRAFTWVARPALWVLQGSSNAVVRLFGIEPQEEMASGHSPRELSALAERSAREGTIDRELAQRMSSSAQLGERVARDAMTPRARVHFLDDDDPVSKLLRLCRRVGHSRFVVVGDSTDHVLGAVHFRDGLTVPAEARRHTPVSEILHPVRSVPSSMPLDNVLEELRGGLQLAVVVDEFGGTDGIITLEDLMEELVGEISDEQDQPEERLARLGHNRWLLSGLLRPDEVVGLVGIELPEGKTTETLGGLVTELRERFVEVGDEVRVPARDRNTLDDDDLPTDVSATLTVTETEGHRVSWVELSVVSLEEAADE
ncbi:hemolysin family protein [Granulicoccus sp. GXG6511]|uniref:hemolysin family protein n=1 Tax=Granulicoccus sp. GXG6511 TaxID=3381351 RepID=UPI003D7ED2B1